VLVAGKDGFHSQHDWPISGQRALFDQGCSIALRTGQCMIIADQDNVGRVQRALNGL